ncbi:hypothetical protein X740_24960 [Mesorhizobium sp. LNHC221B00]|nr:hypothetical protein X740_24960 [Mesorhizobium sp. LNHC221B00]
MSAKKPDLLRDNELIYGRLEMEEMKKKGNW